MKILVVAHPDDEILWFNPKRYDKIIIVFGDFGDARASVGGDKRSQARDIARAKEYWTDYKARKTEETNGTDN